jgi:hypothetical protein
MSIPMTEERKQGRQGDIEAQMAEITEWWRKMSEAEIERTVPKAVHYGAADLDVMGAAMASLLPLDGADDDERAMMGRYAAVAFYILGKISRMFGALEQGRLPAEDTEFDIKVYAMMASRIRETGRWV